MSRFTLLAAAILTITTPAIACSVTPDYRVPTNLELAKGAELVLLGRVVGEETEDGSGPWDSALLVEPIEAIKGEAPESAGAAGTLAIGGVGLVPEERPDFGVLSNPYELAQAHPLSYIGGCIRYMFPAGTTALFFLERDDSGTGWRSAGGPFTRWAEDVLTDDAPWLRLVRLYARAAAQPAAERTALLETERTRLAALPADPVAHLMAADIARQLEGPNQTWHETMEREMEVYRETAELAEAVGEAAEAAADEVDTGQADAMEDDPQRQ